MGMLLLLVLFSFRPVDLAPAPSMSPNPYGWLHVNLRPRCEANGLSNWRSVNIHQIAWVEESDWCEPIIPHPLPCDPEPPLCSENGGVAPCCVPTTEGAPLILHMNDGSALDLNAGSSIQIRNALDI